METRERAESVGLALVREGGAGVRYYDFEDVLFNIVSVLLSLVLIVGLTSILVITVVLTFKWVAS